MIKKIEISILTIVMAGALFSGVVGFTAASTAAEAETEYDKNGWYVASDCVYENGGLTDDGFSSIALDHGGRTINEAAVDLSDGEFTFSLRVGSSGSSVPAYFQLLTAEAAEKWKSVTEYTSVPVKLQFTDAAVTAAVGFVDADAKTPWNSNTVSTHTISVYIGSGEGDDLSYVVYDGVKKTSTAVLSDYAVLKEDGLYSYTAYLNFYASYAKKFELSNTRAPIISSFSNDYFDIRNGVSEELTIGYRNAFSDDFSLYTYQYGGEKYIFEQGVDYTVTKSEKTGNVVLKAAAFEKVNWLSSGAKIYLENSDGISAKAITVVSGDSPVMIGESQIEVSATEVAGGLTFNFTYADNDVPVLEVGQAPAEYTLKGRKVLLYDDSAVMLSNDGENYTCTLSGNYLASLEKGVYYFTVRTKNGDVEYAVYLPPEKEEWVVRSEKGTKGQSSLGDNYVTLSMNGWNGDISTDGRAFYSCGFDVTQPIFIEYTNYAEGGWILFDINDNPYQFEYTMENNMTTPSKIKLLDMVPNADEPRRFGAAAGFVTNSTVGFSSYLNSYNSDVIEIYVGQKISQSYIKVNGYDITESFAVTLKQSQFETGKMYLSIFTATDTIFDTNANVNSVAIYYPNGEPEYTLKSNEDVSVRVVNAMGGLSVSYEGKMLSSSDYTYDLTTGMLTVSGEYLKKQSFTANMRFTVASDNGASCFNVKTYVSEEAGNVVLKEGENPVKYYNGQDLDFSFDMNGETFLSLVDADTEEEVDASCYTFSDGVLTIKSELFEMLPEGVYGYLFTTDLSIVKIYAVNILFGDREYKDISGKAEIDGSLADGLTVKGGGDVYLKNTVGISEEKVLTLQMTDVLGYYNTGSASGNSASYVDIWFSDISSELSIVARIRPNGAEDNTTIRSKLWAELLVVDKNGLTVKREIASFRLSVFDVNEIRVIAENGVCKLYIANESPLELSIDGLGLKTENLLMHFFTNDVDDSFMRYIVRAEWSEQNPTQSDSSDESSGNSESAGSQRERQGCGSVAFVGAAGGCPIAVISVLLRKKRSREGK